MPLANGERRLNRLGQPSRSDEDRVERAERGRLPADRETASVGDALRVLRVDDLVAHDPRRADLSVQPRAHDEGEQEHSRQHERGRLNRSAHGVEGPRLGRAREWPFNRQERLGPVWGTVLSGQGRPHACSRQSRRAGRRSCRCRPHWPLEPPHRERRRAWRARLPSLRSQPRRDLRRGRDRAPGARTPAQPRPSDRAEHRLPASRSRSLASVLDLALVDRHLGRDGVGQLGEPADVADDERLAEREGADCHPGGLAHRRASAGSRTRRSRRAAAKGRSRRDDRGGATPSPSRSSARSTSEATAPARTSRASGSRRRSRANASRSCGIRFAAFRYPTQARTGRASRRGPAAEFDRGPRRHGDHRDRPRVAVLRGQPLDVPRVADHAVRLARAPRPRAGSPQHGPPRSAAADGRRRRAPAACPRRRRLAASRPGSPRRLPARA